MYIIKKIILALFLILGIFFLPFSAVQAHGPAFDNVLYNAFYDGIRASGTDMVNANCQAAFLTATTKWHGPNGYEEPADHHVGDTMWEVIWEGHPFVQATTGLDCGPNQTGLDKYGKSASGNVSVDLGAICKTNSSDAECDLTERQRLTFVVAREVGHAYCFMQTGSDTCGYSPMVAECVVDYYAHHLMEVPWSGDSYSYYTMCVTHGGLPD